MDSVEHNYPSASGAPAKALICKQRWAVNCDHLQRETGSLSFWDVLKVKLDNVANVADSAELQKKEGREMTSG